MIRKTIYTRAVLVPLGMMLLMALGFYLQYLGVVSACTGAIMPLVPEGLLGILTAPFLHGDLEHLTGNALPMAVLLFLLFQFYPRIAKSILVQGWIFTGLLVWLIPEFSLFEGGLRSSCVIGASGIVYMLAFFLFFSGVFRRDKKLLTIALLVALYYGSIIWGIFPQELFFANGAPSRISWQSHLAGAAVGSILSYIYKEVGEKPRKFIWEFPNYYSEKDDQLWQAYLKNQPEEDVLPSFQPKDEAWQYLEELVQQEKKAAAKKESKE